MMEFDEIPPGVSVAEHRIRVLHQVSCAVLDDKLQSPVKRQPTCATMYFNTCILTSHCVNILEKHKLL